MHSAETLETILAILESHGCKPTPSGAGYTAYCPVHENDHNGHKPSLTVNRGDKQSILLHCHAGCDYRKIADALGLEKPASSKLNGKRQVAAIYPYCDSQGNEVRQKIRYEPKDFRIRHQNAAGGWVYKAGPGPAVLYRLPELNRSGDVFFCEGEKDADRLRSLGLCATTNIEGAAQPNQKAKWRREYTEQLGGAARLILLPDNDGPGKAHAAHIAKVMRGKVGEIRIVELPSLPAKGDISDWLNQGHSIKALLELVDATKPEPAKPAAKPESAERPANHHGPERPAKIRVVAGGLPEATDEAEAALIQHGTGIYQRSGYLCRISHKPEATVRGITRPCGAVTITPLERDILLD